MNSIEVEPLALPGVLLLRPRRHIDDRGFFSEVYRSDGMGAVGIDLDFVQDNHAYSSQPGVLRGLHFQTPPHAQGKLVRCVKGKILDVAVDIRRGSPTYGRHVSAELSAENWKQIWVPPGFAHGYVTLVPDCEIIYKVTDYYSPADDRGIAWNDPDLGIDWMINPADAILSPKDTHNPRLRDAPPAFEYAGAAKAAIGA